jgi:hypothetical protein
MVEIGSRVVVIIDGKEVADGKLEAWDGSPEGVSCAEIPCSRLRQQYRLVAVREKLQ